MTYDESEENITLALTELDTVRNILNREHKATMQIYDKFNRACEYFRCRGEIQGIPMSANEIEGYYDSSNSIMTKYFMSSDDKFTRLISTFSLVCISLCIIVPLGECLSRVLSAIEVSADFMLALIPVLVKASKKR